MLFRTLPTNRGENRISTSLAESVFPLCTAHLASFAITSSPRIPSSVQSACPTAHSLLHSDYPMPQLFLCPSHQPPRLRGCLYTRGHLISNLCSPSLNRVQVTGVISGLQVLSCRALTRHAVRTMIECPLLRGFSLIGEISSAQSSSIF